jgi:hypothetical protein
MKSSTAPLAREWASGTGMPENYMITLITARSGQEDTG